MSIIPAGASRQIFRAGLTLRKHAPTIAFVGGIAGSIASTVLACRATLELAEDLPAMKDELDDVRRVNKESNGEHFKDVAYVYGKNATSVAMAYAPAVILGAASITALTGSHIALNRRNAGLTAAYAAVAKAYDEYRDKVRDDIGEEAELDIYRGLVVEKAKNSDGKKVVIKHATSENVSPYAKFFDEWSTEWSKNAEINKAFLRCQEAYHNQRLQVRGHVFLNEVYEALGLPHTKAGAVVGWVLSDKGDNYIDFGLYDEKNVDFINGLERSILLDFNVDGVIFDKI